MYCKQVYLLDNLETIFPETNRIGLVTASTVCISGGPRCTRDYFLKVGRTALYTPRPRLIRLPGPIHPAGAAGSSGSGYLRAARCGAAGFRCTHIHIHAYTREEQSRDAGAASSLWLGLEIYIDVVR